MLQGPQPLWSAHSPAVAEAPLSAPSSHNGDDTVEAEARNLQKVYGDKRDALVALLSGQLGVLKTEAQAILGLCGLVLTVTGFSGGNVIKAGGVGSAFLVTGIVFIISAVIIAMHTLGSIRWVTQDLDDDAVAFIKRVIFRRDAQRRRLMLAISLLVLGLTSYMTAVSIAALVHGQVRDAFAPSPPPVP